MKKKTARRLASLLHFFTSCLLVLKGVDEISARLYFPGTIILFFGITTAVIAFLWKPLRISPKQSKVAVYYIEAPALLFCGYMLYREGRDGMPHLFVIAALLYYAMGIVSSQKFRRIKKGTAF